MADCEERRDVTALLAEAARPAGALEPDGFEIAYVTEDSVEQRMPLADAFAVPVRAGDAGSLVSRA